MYHQPLVSTPEYISKEDIQRVWNNTSSLPNYSSNKYRFDYKDHKLYRHSYLKPYKMGWFIEYIKALDDGGRDDVNNMRATSMERTYRWS